MLATKLLSAKEKKYTKIFAALGDQIRWSLVLRLGKGTPQSISQLTQGSNLTRQAITKHLKILQNANIVHCTRAGRESLFTLEAQTFNDMKNYLDFVARQWDQALSRLKAFVENDN
ncbi:ArsR/SmtB family transcription factor [Legionella cardiaca]|uniref:Helix-turn-helix transcriptional regulator n=1 Tax=Legionella cardiaca TaxID=1071983 RepID=A0ABY8ATF0_9GAMM|nr:helix-turn-helix transcriptional regulator [Legionella cardiaca]WED42417.1 helix-turn-helix transcriptional regulator [Legionella cardiaca]